MAHTKLCTLRRRAFDQQHGFCHYCGLPMWEADESAFAARFSLSVGLTRSLRSTAEHLVARCDGGRDERSNIVAACLWCNQRRHLGRCETAPSAEAYLQRVTRRTASGLWHPANSNPQVLESIRWEAQGQRDCLGRRTGPLRTEKHRARRFHL